MVRHLRQPPGRQHVFQIRHDVFVPDRPENRLLKSALEQICRLTQTPAHWRLAQELRSLFQEVPACRDVASDFKAWRVDRLMAHYQPVRPWCELVLYRQMPLSLVGEWRGISLLFPMEKLFERYVASMLRRSLAADARLVTQAASKALCEHDGGPIFRLQPDLLIEQGKKRWVLDTKWKRLDGNDKANHYALSQADFYQLFAYGQKYLSGEGQLALIYPKRESFTKPLPLFDFGLGLSLWVLPFDLDTGCLVHESLTSLPFLATQCNSTKVSDLIPALGEASVAVL
jgi:5-methylcytosine-specific restriction enzyme subunit McrC